MLAWAALAFILSVFSFIPLISTSGSADTVKNVNWAHTTKGLADGLYIGSNKFVSDSDNKLEAYSWKSDTCKAVQDLYNEHFCNECEHGFQFIIGFTCIFFIFGLPSIIFSVVRGLEFGVSYDIVAQHIIITCSIISFMFGIAAVSVFSKTCLDYWPFSKSDYDHGAAFVLIIVVVIFRFLEILFHAFTTCEDLSIKSSEGNMQIAPA
jgi:hypothetical protein